MKKSCYIVLLGFTLLTGCFSGTTERDTNSISGNIKVMTWLDETYFNQQYGSFFQSKYPNMQVEVFSARELETAEQFDQMYEEVEPDLLVLDSITYERYSQENKLYDLNALIQEHDFDIENINENVMRYLRAKGAGMLYGLSPSFSTFALFFNKHLFSDYNIDIPVDRMSWEEVIHLAQLFPSEEDVIGLLLPKNNPFMMATIMARSQSMSYLDSAHKNITVDSPEWNSIFEKVLLLYRDYKEPEDTDEKDYSSRSSYLKKDGFISGKAAMAFKSSHFIGDMQFASKSKELPKFDWDIVTGPINPTSPNIDPYFAIGDIFAITSDSGNKEFAWEFLSYFNGNDFAVAKSKLSTELSSRTALIKDNEGHNVESLYMLNYTESNVDFNQIHYLFRSKFEQIANEQLFRVIDGNIELTEAIAAIVQKGEEELIQLRLNE